MKYGIDISSHQGELDFLRLKDEVDFIILRAAWGTNTDSRFEQYYSECKKYGIPVGAYLYSYSLDVKTSFEEANYMVNLIKGKLFDYPIYIDMEDGDNYKYNNGMPSNEVLTSICNNFCNILENNGYYVGVYASQSWFDTKLNITKYDKWIANWGTNDGTVQKDLSNLCGMYQYTSKKQILDRKLDGDISYKDYPKIMRDKKLNGYNDYKPDKPGYDEFGVGDTVMINTPYHYKYYVADDVLKAYGLYQVREDWNAGGSMLFSWKDNGIPEKFVDIVNSNGKKVWNSDFIHIKKGNKFKFNRTFTISRITVDKGIKYYQMDSGLGNKYRFWVVGNFLSKV